MNAGRSGYGVGGGGGLSVAPPSASSGLDITVRPSFNATASIGYSGPASGVTEALRDAEVDIPGVSEEPAIGLGRGLAQNPEAVGLTTTTRAGLSMGGGLGSTIRPSFGAEEPAPPKLPEATSLAALAARSYGGPADPPPEPQELQQQQQQHLQQPQHSGFGAGPASAAPSGGFVQGGGLGQIGPNRVGQGLRTPQASGAAASPNEESQAPASGSSITFGMFNHS